MSSLLSILRDSVPYQRALSLFCTLTLDRLNGFVDMLVGLATFIYLCFRIRQKCATAATRLAVNSRIAS